MHINAAAEEVEIRALVGTIDPKTGEKVEKGKARPRFIKQGNIADVEFEISGGVICIEAFKDFPQMGRFTLRDEGKTIAMGKVLKVAKHTEVE
jgi:peptide chain release factor subunit 3